MTEDLKYELIEKFLEERLSEEEAITFRELLDSDTAFKSDVKQQLDVQSALQAIYASNKKVRINREARKILFKRTNIYLIASLAACLIILILFGYTYHYFKSEISNSTLALQQRDDQQKILQDEINMLQSELLRFSDIDSSAIKQSKLELKEKEKQIAELKEQLLALQSNPISDEKEQIAYSFLADNLFEPIEGNAGSIRSTNTEFQKALQFYYDHKYTEANMLFEALLATATGSLKTDVMFYYGSSCLAAAIQDASNKELMEKASELFGAIVQMPSNPLYEEAKWNLTLTYLKLGKKNDSIALLEEIVKDKGYHNQEAESLLNLLK